MRVAHWSLAACVLAAWITAELESKRRGERTSGSAMPRSRSSRCASRGAGAGPALCALQALRRGPAHTLAYARARLRGAEPRYLGHNPLGGWMVVALLATAALAARRGWLSVTDRFWGVEWVQEVHEALGNAIVVLAVLHVAGVVYTSWRQRENLAAAMVSGVKRPPEPGDVA